MSIVRTGHGGRRLGLRGGAARMNRMIDQRFATLGYGYTAADYAPDQYSPTTSPFYSDNPVSAISALSPSSYGGSSSGGLTPADASVISAAISAAGKVGTQAIIGTPQVTYNPLTGQYTATGGATLPSTLGLTTSLTAYLPYILLGGGLLLVVMMGKR